MSDALDMSRPSWKLYNKLVVLGVSVDEASDLMNGYAHELADQQREWIADQTDLAWWADQIPDVIDPEKNGKLTAGPVRPDEEPT